MELLSVVLQVLWDRKRLNSLGSVADAFTLLEGLEGMMAKYPDQTLKACIKYAKQWRTGITYNGNFYRFRKVFKTSGSLFGSL